MAQFKKVVSVNVGKGKPGKEQDDRNPGRVRIGPNSCMGYYDSRADPWYFVHIDDFVADFRRVWDETGPHGPFPKPPRPNLEIFIKNRPESLLPEFLEKWPNLEHALEYYYLTDEEKEEYKENIKLNLKHELYERLIERFPNLNPTPDRPDSIIGITPDYWPHTEASPWSYATWKLFKIPHGDDRDRGPRENEEGYFVPPVFPDPRGVDEVPDWVDFDGIDWIINRKVEWASGPPDNDLIQDNVVAGNGWWCEKGDPTGKDKDKNTGLQILTSSDRPKMLFNMGHWSIASHASSEQTNCIGWDGKLYAEDQGKVGTRVGICQAYAIYKLDATLDDLGDLMDAGEEFICQLFNNGPSFCNTAREGRKPAKPELIQKWQELYDILDATEEYATPETKAPVFNVILWLLDHLIQLFFELVEIDPILGTFMVNWDWIAPLSEPVEGNEYEYCPDKDGKLNNNPYENWFWGEKNENWEPRRFAYIISKESQIITQFLKMKANGVLWHMSSPEGGLRARVLRTYDFAQILSLSPTTRPHDEISQKYEVVPHHYEKDQDERNPWEIKHQLLRTEHINTGDS